MISTMILIMEDTMVFNNNGGHNTNNNNDNDYNYDNNDYNYNNSKKQAHFDGLDDDW